MHLYQLYNFNRFFHCPLKVIFPFSFCYILCLLYNKVKSPLQCASLMIWLTFDLHLGLIYICKDSSKQNAFLRLY